jgi:hypothetical protein
MFKLSVYKNQHEFMKDFEVGENSCLGYQYEPEYTEEELAAATATNEESTNNEEDEAIDNNFKSFYQLFTT